MRAETQGSVARRAAATPGSRAIPAPNGGNMKRRPVKLRATFVRLQRKADARA